MLSRDEFASSFALKPGLNWIHVVSAHGESIGDEVATSDGVTNPEDREFLFAMRAKSDAIFVSAKTAIAENYRASKFAPIFIIDRNNDADAAALATVATADKNAVLVVGSVDEALGTLAEGKQSRILLEAGRTMVADLFADDESPIAITQALVTVVTSNPRLGERIANDLLAELGAAATITTQLVADNVYFAFDLRPIQRQSIT